MPSSKSIGIIGAGNIVFNAHLPVLKAMGCEVRWILDASEARAIEAGEAYGIPNLLRVEELCDSPSSDIVLLACPYGSRGPYYDFLRDRTCAVYIEKPLARSVRELDSICRLRPAHLMAAGFHRRSMGSVNIVRHLIEDGIFGNLLKVEAEFGTATIISSGGGFAKDASLAGGGQLIESAIHTIDAVCYMAGIQIARVTGCKMEQENGFDLHTEADLVLVNTAGSEIDMSLVVTCFYTTENEITLTFDNAVLGFSVFKKSVPTIQTFGNKRSYQILDSLQRDYPNEAYDTLRTYWLDFLDGADSGQSNYTNARSTTVTTSIIEQLYEMGRSPSELVRKL